MRYKAEKIYSYIVVKDNGYSPHPFGKVLTMPWCKPTLRKAAAKNIGDYPAGALWMVGLSPAAKGAGNDIVFLAQISQALGFAEYYQTFPEKRPRLERAEHIFKIGDNCYKPDEQASLGFRQLPGIRSSASFLENYSEDEKNKQKDLSGQAVLVSRQFVYFGSKPLPLPPQLLELKVGQGYKSNFSEACLEAFNGLLNQLEPEIAACTVKAAPHLWPQGDTSWQMPLQ